MQFRTKGAVTGLVAALAIGVATTAVAALLGIVVGFPKMASEGGLTTAEINNGSFTVSATPTIMLISNVGPLVPVSGPSSLDISVTTDAACNLTGGVAGDDLLITGTVDVDPLGVGDVRTGVLLTGEVLAMGVGDPSGTIDPFDFRFQVTGGALADFYTNEDAGVTLNVENFMFAGDCSGIFQGKPKADVGPIPPVPPASGCTPGYWKQSHHFDSWEATGFDPAQTVLSVYGSLDPSVDNLTLEAALKLKGGGTNALMRHSVASLLNAAHPDVNNESFPTVDDVIAATQAAFAIGGDIEGTKNAFEEANEEGCPIN